MKIETKYFTTELTCYSDEELQEVSFMEKKSISLETFLNSEIPFDDKIFGLSLFLEKSGMNVNFSQMATDFDYANIRHSERFFSIRFFAYRISNDRFIKYLIENQKIIFYES